MIFVIGRFKKRQPRLVLRHNSTFKFVTSTISPHRRYAVDSKLVVRSAEIDRRIREEFVPIVKKAKGFVRYYWLGTGKGEGASVSVFKAGADESVHLAADYVKDSKLKPLSDRGSASTLFWAIALSSQILNDGDVRI